MSCVWPSRRECLYVLETWGTHWQPAFSRWVWPVDSPSVYIWLDDLSCHATKRETIIINTQMCNLALGRPDKGFSKWPSLLHEGRISERCSNSVAPARCHCMCENDPLYLYDCGFKVSFIFILVRCNQQQLVLVVQINNSFYWLFKSTTAFVGCSNQQQLLLVVQINNSFCWLSVTVLAADTHTSLSLL